MGIEEEYRRATKGLGPVFLATVILLVVLLVWWALHREERVAEASSMIRQSSAVALA